VTIAEIETEQVRVGLLIERPTVAARATRSVSVAVMATAPTAVPPVSYGGY
jgi:hypothetical protein